METDRSTASKAQLFSISSSSTSHAGHSSPSCGQQGAGHSDTRLRAEVSAHLIPDDHVQLVTIVVPRPFPFHWVGGWPLFFLPGRVAFFLLIGFGIFRFACPSARASRAWLLASAIFSREQSRKLYMGTQAMGRSVLAHHSRRCWALEGRFLGYRPRQRSRASP